MRRREYPAASSANPQSLLGRVRRAGRPRGEARWADLSRLPSSQVPVNQVPAPRFADPEAPALPAGVSVPVSSPISPRQAAWLLLCPPEALKPEQIIAQSTLCEVSNTIAQAHSLAQTFVGMLRQRKEELLDPWLADAEDSVVAEIRHFALHLKRDYQAVKAALRLPWSNGPVEGHIHRLKLIKRQMYAGPTLPCCENESCIRSEELFTKSAAEPIRVIIGNSSRHTQLPMKPLAPVTSTRMNLP